MKKGDNWATPKWLKEIFSYQNDKIVTFFVGREGKKDYIKSLSFIADCDPQTLDAILDEDKAVRSCLGIDDSFYKGDRHVFYREGRTRLYAEVDTVEGNLKASQLNLVLLKERRYTILQSEYLQELKERDIPYLKMLLSRRKQPVTLTDAQDQYAERLKNLVFERQVFSITDRVRKLTSEAWMKIILIVTSLLIPLYLWLGLSDLRDALITVSVIAITLVLTSAQELFKITRRRREK